MELRRRAGDAGCTIDEIIEVILLHQMTLDDLQAKETPVAAPDLDIGRRQRRRG